MEEVKMKKCSRCKEIKTIKCFNKDNKRKDGLQCNCKACAFELKKRINDIKRAGNMPEEEKIDFLKEQEFVINKRRKFIDLDSNCKENYKICSVCLEEKPSTIEFFNKDISKWNGLYSICKECTSKKNKERNSIKKEQNNKNIYIYTVYAHINKINGKTYIGTTKRDVRDRWRKGKRYEPNKEFYNDIIKYGWDEGFYHEIIAGNLTEKEGYNFEKLLIEKLDTINNGYNQVEGGKNAKPTDEVRLKLSKTKRKNSKSIKKDKNHNVYRRNSKRVICDGKTYSSISEFSTYYNLHSVTVGNWLNDKFTMPQKYIDLGLKFIEEDKEKIIGVKVTCAGIIYDSVKKCSDAYNIKAPTMRAWLRGQNNMPQKFKDIGLQYYTEEDNKNKEIA